jgi:MSHA pilin protein MshA
MLLTKQRGFTLIEIICVLIILGILAVIALPKYLDYQMEAQRKVVQAAVAAGIANINIAIANCASKGNTIIGIKPDGTILSEGGSSSCEKASQNIGDFNVEYSGTLPIVTVTVTSGPKWFDKKVMGTEAFGGQKDISFR